MRINRVLLGSLAAAALLIAACAGSPTPRHATTVPPVDPPAMTDTAPRNYAGIHNAVAYHEGFYSGSVPEGEPGFDTLAGMGIKTIISVDGAIPDVDAAKARGIRYIHLPIGYNGFDETRKLELTRATRDALAQGPVYIHCHHGKHRSAGAAAAVAVSLGWASPEDSVARMKVSGTAAGYKGLYKCALESTPVAAATLDSVGADFPAISRPATFVAQMVEMDEVVEHLKEIEKAGWKAPDNHPDLVPAAEAGRLADLLRVSTRGTRAANESGEFRTGLDRSAASAQSIEDLLISGQIDTAALSARLADLQKSCKDCHQKFRD
ncbi:MAG: hypothetical protein ACOYN0_11930 [Phycisphaerales bacterium]